MTIDRSSKRKAHRVPRGYSSVVNWRGIPIYLYHATDTNNLESVKDFGIVRTFRRGLDPERDSYFIHLDASRKGLRDFLDIYYKDRDWTILRVKTENLELNKLYKKTFGDNITWYVYMGDIPPEAIRIVG